MKDNRSIVIWGAGKIGRGFIADLFFNEGYQINFVDQAKSLVENLNSRGEYTVIRAVSENNISKLAIDHFKAFTPDQSNQIQESIDSTNIVAICVFPKIYGEVAEQLRAMILKRREKFASLPLDILLCTNLMHAGPVFKEALYKGLSLEEQEYFDQFIGIVESLVIRICPDLDARTLQKEPLTVLTNGYPVLHVEAAAFRGEIPALKTFKLVQDMRAAETRKIYTYNMCHAVLSYLGAFKGYRLLVDCIADKEIKDVALGALHEVSNALQKEYSFSVIEMQTWIDGVIDQTNNPAVGDTIVRMAADPLRKLSREDRLIGPALLCLRNGIEPINLIHAIGAGFNYFDKDDAAAVTLRQSIITNGIRPTILKVCGLTEEQDELVDEIVRSYVKQMLIYRGTEIAEKAGQLGSEYEIKYHGCGQCVLAAILESLNLTDENVFKAGTGLSGGVGQMTDATCSAFIGGTMAIGQIFARRRKYFNADKANKYKNFELVQELRARFDQKYGSITCKQIHQSKYGQSFDLTKKEEAAAFEESGAHSEKGEPEVVANAAKWTIEILANEFINEMEASKN